MTAATYNTAAIMTEAHEAARACIGHPVYKGRSYASLFAGQLKRIWAEMKRRVAAAMNEAAKTPADKTRDAILALESKSTLTQKDYARLGVLRAALRAHLEHEDAAGDYAEKRELIAAAGGRFCAVTFTKKDGTERTMQVQPAALKGHVKGDVASQAAKRAVATRAVNNPNLLNVWDAKAQAPRSINLATVSRIAVDGQTHNYAA